MITPQPSLRGLASSLETNVPLTWKTTGRIWHRKGNSSQRQKGTVPPGKDKRADDVSAFEPSPEDFSKKYRKNNPLTHFFFFALRCPCGIYSQIIAGVKGKYLHTGIFLFFSFITQKNHTFFPFAFREDVENSSPGKTTVSIPPSLLASQRSDFHS